MDPLFKQSAKLLLGRPIRCHRANFFWYGATVLEVDLERAFIKIKWDDDPSSGTAMKDDGVDGMTAEDDGVWRTAKYCWMV